MVTLAVALPSVLPSAFAAPSVGTQVYPASITSDQTSSVIIAWGGTPPFNYTIRVYGNTSYNGFLIAYGLGLTNDSVIFPLFSAIYQRGGNFTFVCGVQDATSSGPNDWTYGANVTLTVTAPTQYSVLISAKDITLDTGTVNCHPILTMNGTEVLGNANPLTVIIAAGGTATFQTPLIDDLGGAFVYWVINGIAQTGGATNITVTTGGTYTPYYVGGSNALPNGFAYSPSPAPMTPDNLTLTFFNAPQLLAKNWGMDDATGYFIVGNLLCVIMFVAVAIPLIFLIKKNKLASTAIIFGFGILFVFFTWMNPALFVITIVAYFVLSGGKILKG